MKVLKCLSSGFNAILLMSGCFFGAGTAFAGFVTSAFDNSTVQPGGPRAGANGQRFFNMEGSSNGMFASFGVIDFVTPVGAIIGPGAVLLSLSLTQSNAAFTQNGALQFYLTTDTTTDIDAGTSPLQFVATSLPTGIDSQLQQNYLLGSGIFTQVSTGATDTFNFLPSGAALAYLLNEVNVLHGPIRLLVAPADANVAATYTGFSNTMTAGPRLTITDLPEPQTLVCVITGFVLLFGYARSRSSNRQRP
jgi:hypothetical protein